jgi:hypothetical protein
MPLRCASTTALAPSRLVGSRRHQPPFSVAMIKSMLTCLQTARWRTFGEIWFSSLWAAAVLAPRYCQTANQDDIHDTVARLVQARVVAFLLGLV